MDQIQVIILCVGGSIAAAMIGGGLVEIMVGRRKIRTVAHYGVVGRTSWQTVIGGFAFALVVVGAAIGGWFELLTLVGLTIYVWALVHYRRKPARNE